jgi:hypothetical protein
MDKGAELRLLFVDRPVAGRLILVLPQKSSRSGIGSGSVLDAIQQSYT